MTRSPLDEPDVELRAADRVAEVAGTLGRQLGDLSRALHEELAGSIPELQGDPIILDLLRASTESNVETFLHIVQYDINVAEVSAPSAALEYARRLAQRGTSSNALLRAYRLGQRRVTEIASAEISQEEDDGWVAFRATQLVANRAFEYVDRIAEIVVAEYEGERERWLANRNTVRATMLSSVLAGEDVDVAAAEQALGYRLRQHHLGIVLWAEDRSSSTSELRRLESLLKSIAESIGCASPPLFIPQDRSLGWAWLPLGREAGAVDPTNIGSIVAQAGDTLRVSLGTPDAATPGFRSTHLDAVRAHKVASIGGHRAHRVTAYSDPGVRTAALLASDLSSARELVTTTLGALGVDDSGAERLRETLQVFLRENGSFVATADKVHLHKNTVKYRVDKAIEMRGRPLDDDRFNLELALIACRWLGDAVLSQPT